MSFTVNEGGTFGCLLCYPLCETERFLEGLRGADLGRLIKVYFSFVSVRRVQSNLKN